MVAHTSVTLPAKVTATDFAPPQTAGLRRVTSPATSSIFPVRNERSSVLTLELRPDGALGFRLMQVASSTVDHAQTAHLLYSDGIETVSVFVQSGGTSVLANSPGWHTTTILNRTAFENLDGHLNTIAWTQGGYRYSAVSHLGPTALQQFVGNPMETKIN
jgi:hypothetical protein